MPASGIMTSIHATCVHYGQDETGHVNYESGANIAGFVKVADAMLAQGSADTLSDRTDGSPYHRGQPGAALFARMSRSLSVLITLFPLGFKPAFDP